MRDRIAYGENMNVHVHKTTGQRHDVWANFATFRPTSRRSRELNCQRRDVSEGEIFNVATLPGVAHI